MTIVQQGAVNTTAMIVPQLLVQIVPPQTVNLNGVPTNILGAVGTASWGPVGSPTDIGGMADFATAFGPVMPRKYDLGTLVGAAVQQGANVFKCVRVTDGTDTAASGTLTMVNAAVATAVAAAVNGGQSGMRGPSQLVVATASGTTVTLTAKYTGSQGNLLVADTGAGSAAASTSLVVSMPGQVPETFDSIAGGVSAASSVTLAGGADGAAAVTAAMLLGQDVVPRRGMYALRGTGASVVALADCDDSTTWPTQMAYGLAEGSYMILTGPCGDTIANAVSVKSGLGLDSYAVKPMFGDWVYWLDTANGGVVRLISPQGFEAGRLANLSPEQSSLNKPIYGIVGTQKSMANQQYSLAELQTLAAAGIDVITNPIPAGAMFGARLGRNGSSNVNLHGDNYTRMTNYLAATLNAGMGQFIGLLQSTSAADPTRQKVQATLTSFLQGMVQQGMLDSFSVRCDTSNNPASRIAMGYLQCDVQAKYLAVVENLIVNLEGGQSVTVTSVSTSAAA